jgi:hypothetical protein
MDLATPLKSIAGSLLEVPADAVESLLVTFDTLAGLTDDAGRADAARMLREAAGRTGDPVRRERLERAADAVAAGEPCALTPDGLTGRQAAAAQTMTLEEWQAQGGDPAPPPAPVDEEEIEEEDEVDEEEDGEEWEGELPELPHLPVRLLFPGVVVRVRQEFTDARGRLLPAGLTVRLLTSEQDGGVANLVFMEGACSLDSSVPAHVPILENSGNAWLQPVPSRGCLQELCDAILQQLQKADDLDEEDDERVQELFGEVEECQDWLIRDGQPPAPELGSARFAGKVFGRQSREARWVALLVEGLKHCRK